MTLEEMKAVTIKLRECALKGAEREAAANALLNDIARRGLPIELLRIIEAGK